MPVGDLAADNLDGAPEDAVFRLDLVIKAIWRARLIIVACFVLGIISGIVVIRTTGPRYLATVELMPTDSDADRIGSLSSVSSLFSGTSDMPLSRFKQFQAALTSAGVAEQMDAQGYMCMVYPSCDPATRQWAAPAGLSAWIRGRVRGVLALPPRSGGKPDINDFSRFISENVEITQERIGLVTLSFRYRDPAVATKFLSALVRITNDYVKDKDRSSLQRYVMYLSDKLANLTVVSQRDSLQTLLTEQSRRLMLTQVGVPYAANTLDDAPAVPQRPYLMILLFGIAFAVLAAGGAIAQVFLPAGGLAQSGLFGWTVRGDV